MHPDDLSLLLRDATLALGGAALTIALILSEHPPVRGAPSRWCRIGLHRWSAWRGGLMGPPFARSCERGCGLEQWDA